MIEHMETKYIAFISMSLTADKVIQFKNLN